MRLFFVATIVAMFSMMLLPSSVSAQDNQEDKGARIELGGSVEVRDDETLGFLFAADADVLIEGRVEGAVVLLGSDSEISGTVDGNVIAAGGTLRLTESAMVTGDVIYSDTTYAAEPGATISGTVRDDLGAGFGRDFARFMAWLSLANWAGTTVLFLIGGLVFAGVGGRQLWSSAGAMTGKPLQSLLSAILLWTVGTVAIVVLFLSVLGIPAGIMLLLALAMIWMVGNIVAGTRIGAAIVRRPVTTEPAHHPYLPAVVGILVIQIVGLVPVIISLLLAYVDDDGGLSVSAANVVAFAVSSGFSGLIGLLGFLGTGALVYRAFVAWTSPSAGAQP